MMVQMLARTLSDDFYGWCSRFRWESKRIAGCKGTAVSTEAMCRIAGLTVVSIEAVMQALMSSMPRPILLAWAAPEVELGGR